MGFFPDTPITIAYAVALAVTVAFALAFDRRVWPVCAVMVANWIGTRIVTAFDLSPYVASAVDLGSAAVLLALWRAATMAVLPVSALFALMVGSYVLADFNVIGRETMWAFADVGGYLQLLLVAGASIDPGAGHRLAFLGAGGRRIGDLARAVARRV